MLVRPLIWLFLNYVLNFSTGWTNLSRAQQLAHMRIRPLISVFKQQIISTKMGSVLNWSMNVFFCYSRLCLIKQKPVFFLFCWFGTSLIWFFFLLFLLFRLIESYNSGWWWPLFKQLFGCLLSMKLESLFLLLLLQSFNFCVENAVKLVFGAEGFCD